MSFDYDKINGKQEENWWTSYSDLFSMLSVVFLMMYVTASLRSGLGGLQSNIEYKELEKKNAELQEQIRVYDALKEEQLDQSSEQEQEVYQKLMSKLTLLQDEAREEKDALRKQAKENEEKEFALNQYQQIVRNIINTNVLAKTQIKRKDGLIVSKNINIKEKQAIIEEQEQDLRESAQEISQLETSVEEKEATIAENQQKIEQVNQVLSKKMDQLREQQQKAQITRAQYQAEMARLSKESEDAINELESKKRQTQAALQQTRNNLTQVQTAMAEQAQKNAEERERLIADMQEAKAAYQDEVAQLQAEHKAQIQAEKAARDKLKKMTAKARAAAEAKLRAEAKERESEFQKAMGDLKGKIAQSQNELEENLRQVDALKGQVAETSGKLAQTEAEKARLAAEKARLAGNLEAASAEKARLAAETARLAGNLKNVEGEKSRALASVSNLEKERENLSGELKRAQDIANAKKKLTAQIKKNLKAAGLDAEVDGRTGDVVLSFGEEYFDTGSAVLKPSMRGILHKFMPSYSDSLFNDPKVAEKITNVEIIGFASPTYNGKYVNPESLNPKDQEAIRYNVKLSSSRAQSIFNYIFDTKKMQYAKQKTLLPKVKVVGRGYLPDGTKGKDIPEGTTEKEFCSKFNCQKAQRVIIRFNMEN